MQYCMERRCQALKLQLFYIFHVKNAIILLIGVIRTNNRAAVVRGWFLPECFSFSVCRAHSLISHFLFGRKQFPEGFFWTVSMYPAFPRKSRRPFSLCRIRIVKGFKQKIAKVCWNHCKYILIRHGHRIGTQMVFDSRVFELGLKEYTVSFKRDTTEECL